MRKILFLCTGNYYRSRFAEHLFNHFARQQELKWHADSRALALERGINNVGAISKYALAALQVRGIHLSDGERFPTAAKPEDFKRAHHIIALDKSEHLPLMRDRFPEWADKIEYWLVHDIDRTVAVTALEQIAVHIEDFLKSLD